MTQEAQPQSAAADPAEEDFEALFEASMRAIAEGSVVKGTVLRVDPDHVLVDIGYKSEGLIATWEFGDENSVVRVMPGDEVEVMIESAEGEDGTVLLSKEKADRLRVWDDLASAYEG
jgi:small subunit ribosomal protein S1